MHWTRSIEYKIFTMRKMNSSTQRTSKFKSLDLNKNVFALMVSQPSYTARSLEYYIAVIFLNGASKNCWLIHTCRCVLFLLSLSRTIFVCLYFTHTHIQPPTHTHLHTHIKYTLSFSLSPLLSLSISLCIYLYRQV